MNKFYDHVQLLRTVADGLLKTQYCSDVKKRFSLRKYYYEKLSEITKDIETLLFEEISDDGAQSCNPHHVSYFLDKALQNICKDVSAKSEVVDA